MLTRGLRVVVHPCIMRAEKGLAGELDPSADELYSLIDGLYNSTFEIRDSSVDTRLALLEKLLPKVDQDEDDEMEKVIEAADGIIGNDGPVEKVLEVMVDAGVNFTEPRYYQRELTNLRDYLLKHKLSPKLVVKMAELGIDMNEALAFL